MHSSWLHLNDFVVEGFQNMFRHQSKCFKNFPYFHKYIFYFPRPISNLEPVW
jgi:hypothetical protein